MKYRYNAIVSHKLKTLLASSLTSTNCQRLSIITVEGCGLTIAHAYFGFELVETGSIFARTGRVLNDRVVPNLNSVRKYYVESNGW